MLNEQTKANYNPKAKIGFIIFYPFQFYVYKNIYKHIADKAEFIVDLGVFYPVRQPDHLLPQILKLLEKYSVHYRVVNFEDYFAGEYLEKFFAQYEVLVSLWERGVIKKECNWSKRKVSMAYGGGKELTMVRPSRAIYDLILAYGEHDYNLFSFYTQAKIVGNPKFDDWFNGDFETDFIEDIKNKLDAKKKTVLYLPTHGDLSSIDELSDDLKKIAGDYNIIVKHHYFTAHEELERGTVLTDPRIIPFADDTDLLPLLRLSDVVISDNSSAIFDAIFADKPVVVTDFLSDEYLDTEHKKTKIYRRGSLGAVTYSGSIENKIKREGLVLTVKNPQELREKIEAGLSDDVFFKKSRKEIRDSLLAFQDGNCGKRAAKEILDLSKAVTLPPRPILFHVTGSLGVSKYHNSSKTMTTNFHDVQSTVFSVVLNIFESDLNAVEQNLKLLLLQKFPSYGYEIIITDSVVVDIAREEQLNKIVEIYNINKVKIVKAYIQTNDLPEIIAKSTALSQGTFIAFTSLEYFYKAHWLSTIFMAHMRHPEATCLGGYVKTLPESDGMFQSYYKWELCEKLNIKRLESYPEHGLIEMVNRDYAGNPAGFYYNSAYKKNVIAKFVKSDMPTLLDIVELNIKYNISLLGGEMCFTNNPIFRKNRIGVVSFANKCFSMGFAWSFTNPRFIKNTKSYHYSFLGVFTSPIKALLEYKNLKLAGIVFMGHLLRYSGRIYGAILFMMIRLLNKLSDYPQRL